jgi:CBS-domain-containing membrane protein
MAGLYTTVCTMPRAVFCDWQQAIDDLPGGAVRNYMTADVVTVGPLTPLPELARMMVDAHIHRIPVTERGQPVGVVSSTDVLAAVAQDWMRSAEHKPRPPAGQADEGVGRPASPALA